MAQIDTTRIQRIEMYYYKEGGYALIKIHINYEKKNGVVDKLFGTYQDWTSIGGFPMVLSESEFVKELAKLERIEREPMIIALDDTMLVKDMNFDLVNFNLKSEHHDQLDSIKVKQILKELAGKPESYLEVLVRNSNIPYYLKANSIRDWSSIKVFYSDNGYLSFEGDNCFSMGLVKHGKDWGDQEGECIKVDDRALMAFFRNFHLQMLAIDPDRADLLLNICFGYLVDRSKGQSLGGSDRVKGQYLSP